MNTTRLPSLFVVGLILAATPECPGLVDFQIRLGGSTAISTAVSPGSLLTLDVVATGIDPEAGVLGNLDAFTYRIEFPDQQFTLESDAFAAPFDNVAAPAGFNGSIPWLGLPVAIDFAADAGSPGATVLVADLYRTTATQPASPVSGSDVVLETFSVRVPSPPVGSLPVDFAIGLNVLEAVDQLGAFHEVRPGADFVLTVIPEPAATATAIGLVLAAGRLAWRRRGGRERPA